MDRIDLENPDSWENKNLNTLTMAELYGTFGLDA